MRILLDENLPRDFAATLVGHEVKTVGEVGWKGVKNGELLRRAGERFDVFLSMDKGIEHQQNLSLSRLRIIILRARSNRIEDLRSAVPTLLKVLADIHTGELRHVDKRK